MIIFYHLPWRWLCWIGLHEWTIGIAGWDNDEPLYEDFWRCDACGRMKPR